MQAKQFIHADQLEGFERLLDTVNVDTLSITPYAKRYLLHIIRHKKYYTRIYARLLNLALKNSTKKKEDISLVDYGAGNGVMGLLAKYTGVGKVYLDDMSVDFLNAAKQLAAELKIELDGYIEGDIDQLKTYFTRKVPDVMVGTDVIEHIYNLEHFFKTIQQLNPAMVTVMSTACNPANYCKVNEYKKVQVKDELHGGSPADHALFGETAMEPFIETRRKIITEYGKGLLDSIQINEMARATRGLRKDDIEKAVDRYLADKIMPAVLSHPANTCDPLTGSWSERMLSFEEYRRIYASAGFKVYIVDGFYNQYQQNLKGSVIYFVNKVIPFTGHCLSPFVILVGKQKID